MCTLTKYFETTAPRGYNPLDYFALVLRFIIIYAARKSPNRKLSLRVCRRGLSLSVPSRRVLAAARRVEDDILVFPISVVHVGLWHSSVGFIRGIWSQALPPWTSCKVFSCSIGSSKL